MLLQAVAQGRADEIGEFTPKCCDSMEGQVRSLCLSWRGCRSVLSRFAGVILSLSKEARRTPGLQKNRGRSECRKLSIKEFVTKVECVTLQPVKMRLVTLLRFEGVCYPPFGYAKDTPWLLEPSESALATDVL